MLSVCKSMASSPILKTDTCNGLVLEHSHICSLCEFPNAKPINARLPPCLCVAKLRVSIWICSISNGLCMDGEKILFSSAKCNLNVWFQLLSTDDFDDNTLHYSRARIAAENLRWHCHRATLLAETVLQWVEQIVPQCQYNESKLVATSREVYLLKSIIWFVAMAAPFWEASTNSLWSTEASEFYRAYSLIRIAK